MLVTIGDLNLVADCFNDHEGLYPHHLIFRCILCLQNGIINDTVYYDTFNYINVISEKEIKENEVVVVKSV